MGNIVRKSSASNVGNMVPPTGELAQWRRGDPEARAAQQAAVARLGLYALSEHDTGKVMERAVDTLANTLNAEFCKVLELRPGELELVLKAGVGWRAGCVGAARVPIDAGSQAGFTLHSHEPVLVEDFQTETRFIAPALLTTHGVVSGMSVVIEGAGGRPYGVLGVHSARRRAFTEQDVNFVQAVANLLATALERENIEAELRESRRFTQRIADAVPSLVYILEWPAAGIVYANEQVSKALGSTPDDLRAMAPAALQNHLHWEDAEKLAERAAWLAAAKDGDVLETEFRMQYADGKWHWLQAQEVVFARTPDGTPSQILGTAQDITEHKRAEAALVERDRLAAVGQLAAGIAHDFNNILTVVVGVAERLKGDRELAQTVREKLDLIAQQGQRGSQLIRQIMDFSRRSAASRESVDLAALVTETVLFLKGTIPEHILLTTLIPPGRYVVYADPAQLQQVLTNLALNARDAMPEGGELRFGLSRFVVHADAEAPVAGMAPGDWILLSVSDTGTGMASEVLQHAFEPFFTTKERGKGTGLGLAQAYGLIKQHDGFIDVTSTVGYGTTFTLYLPAGASSQAAADFEGSPTLTAGAGQTVLLVEDEAAVRAVVGWQLEGMGYRVLAASSGEEAWQVFRRHAGTVALVVLDLVMPGMGGATLYRLLRQANPELPVIVLSGYPPGAAVAGLSGDEAVEWLQKPAGFDELAGAVRRALKADI
jgi:two-component system cell cycle sensor histidine kinase/response regulator CckA